jgi:methyl-accepting chemotaxis protein
MAAGRSRVEVTVGRNPIAGWVADRSVNAKSLAAAALAALVALVVGIISINRMAELNRDLTAIRDQHVAALDALNEVRTGVAGVFRGMFLYEVGTVVRTPALSAQGRADTRTADAMVDAALARYRDVAAGSAERQRALDAFTEAQDYYRSLRDAVVFQEAPPAGVRIPPADQIEAAFTKAEAEMNGALADLQQMAHDGALDRAEEATSEYERARTLTITCLAIGLVLALLVGLWVARIMRRQLAEATAALRALADGDLSHTADVRARDELGRMTEAVNRASAAIRTTVEALAAGARTLGDSSRQLTGVTGRIGGSAQEAAVQANLVAAAAGDVSANVQTVAAGSTEMGASIRQIAQNANDAAQVAAEAVEVAESTNHTVSKLGDSSAEIGNVVKVITSIAEQTNLLALNATIEAARAGEAGKGFAVVANEVKDLAQETARATEDISRRVEAIQSDSTNAVAAIGEISRIIARINDYQLTIASAVEEQTATTGEMSRSVGEAATGTTDIAANISGVAQATQATTATLAEAEGTVKDLASLAAELETIVGRFKR